MVDHAKEVEDILGDWGWAGEYDNEVVEVQDDSIYIIGLDPGETTGLALIRIDTKKKGSLPELLFLDQVPDGRYGFKDYFYDFVIDENTIVVSEKWKERNLKGANREPQYIEGSMHMLWDDSNIEYQYPEMKALIPDEFLKEQGVWTEGKRHQMDALIHALAWLRNQAGGGGGGGGQGDGDSNAVADAAQALAEALGGESDQKMGDQGQGAQGDGTGQGDGYGHTFTEWAQDRADEKDAEGAGHAKTEDPKDKRKERSLNDGFIGFESAEANEAGTTLLDD